MKTKKIVISSVLLMTLVAGISSTTFAQTRGQGQGNGQGQGQGMGMGNSDIEKPDNFMDMTREERQAYMRSQGVTPGSNRSENSQRPENFETMTEAEKIEHRNNNQAQNSEKRQMNQGQNKFNKNAKKAKNYKKFTGSLEQKKDFKDKSKIKNLEAVEFLQQRGILDGYADGSFQPQYSINRAESIKVLLESLGEAPDNVTYSQFSDVPKDAWFAGYVNKAKRKGIVKGYSDGTFQPSKTVNQVELLKLAFESFGIDLNNYPVNNLPSNADKNAWYASYLQYAIDNNLLESSSVNPGEGMTRENFSEVIYRLIQQQENL